METPRKQYTQEFKLKAIELIKQRGNLAQVAKDLNMSKNTLINWQRLNNKGKLEFNSSSPVKLKSKEELENIRLRKELYDTKMERDILKKAVSIFSKSDK
jgi:transposase